MIKIYIILLLLTWYCTNDKINDFNKYAPLFDNNDSVVYIISTNGCSKCKNDFFEWVQNDKFPKNYKFVITGSSYKEIKNLFPKMISLDNVVFDTNNLVSNFNFYNANDEIILLRKGFPIKKFTYLMYHEAMLY